MNSQILASLKRKLIDISAYGEVDVETQRNMLKEELQFYVLDFIYHHPNYSRWIMYGGSVLRICHGLDRMSVDLDFEVAEDLSDKFLQGLKRELGDYFKNTHGAEADFLTIKVTAGRGLLLRFHIGDEMGIKHPSKQVHVKIDLNQFINPGDAVERRPINHDQLSFVIKTYNMSVLMASKIAAIFLRGQRGVGKALYEEKGRDIYDLLWYMDKRVVPDLDYLIAKGVDAKDPRVLFDKLTMQMNKVSDTNLKQDLSPLFKNQKSVEDWLKIWRESYMERVESYCIRTVKNLVRGGVGLTVNAEVLSFIYYYSTEEGSEIRMECRLSEDWMEEKEGELTIIIDDYVVQRMTHEAQEATGRKAMKQKQYATLFYRKIESHLKKTNRIMLGDTLTTKIIRMTADHLNRKDQILLNKSMLFTCELKDLLP